MNTPTAVAPTAPQEDVPDGTFGHARSPAAEHDSHWSPDEQHEHRAQLLAALDGFCVGHALHRTPPRTGGRT